MRTLTALALTLLFMGCKRSTDVQPDEIRNEPVVLIAKDVETNQSTLSLAYQKIFNVTRNGYIGVTEAKTSLDVSDIRPAVEAYISAHPDDYTLYFRLEYRGHKPDLLLPDGSRKLRAGPLSATVSLGQWTHGGSTVDAKQNPYAWDRVNAELQKVLVPILSTRTVTTGPLKVMLSVYDVRRFTSDPSHVGDFDGSTTKPHAEGGSRVVYRGWNVELK